jgi:phage FluMu protein gp41
VADKDKALQGEIVQPAELVVLRGADLTQDIIEANPERYRVLRNGAIYDNEAKRIVKAPENNTINQENAREMLALRWEKARQAVAAGMIEGAASIKDISPSNVTEYDAVSLMAANLTNIAATKQDRAAIEAFRAVSQAAGLVQERGQQVSSDAPALQINVSGDALARLLQLMQGIDSD